jgi:predicted O-linked N-acetylglucosamine transferase (SPINDLY family)/ADP-heptose:LPS heptosyltransferase
MAGALQPERSSQHRRMKPQDLTEQRPDAAGATLKRLFARANAEQAEGRLADAEATCRAIIARDETHAGAWHLLAVIALRSGDAETAAKDVERAVALAPQRADCRHTLGFILKVLRRQADAEAAFRQAITLDPTFVETHYQLGNLLREAQRPAEAEASYRAVLALRPDHYQAHNNIGAALGELGRFEEAAEHFHRATELKPDYAEAYANLGHALRAIGRAEDAEAACRRAIAIAPGFATAHLNLGLALQDLGRLDESLTEFRAAEVAQPDYAKAIASEAILLLQRGDFAAGWEKYEARWRIGDLPPRNFEEPQWRGEPLAGKTILLHAEQGFGDAIQFLRYVPSVVARGGKVVVEVRKPLIPLVARMAGIEVVARGERLPAFDVQCPLMSLPLAFATTLETIPATTPYLTPAPERAAYWRNRIDVASGLKVGLAWAGSAVHRNDRNRSIPLDALSALIAVEGTRWFSLQVGPRAADLAARKGLAIADLAPELGDFGETAAVIAALDLVVTADTAVAHLAGALGKPVWVMLPFAADWRWMVGRDDSPWYPSMRLFRQPRPGDWTSVAAGVRAALAERAAQAPRLQQRAPVTRAELAALVRAANEHHHAKRHAECEATLRRVLESDPKNSTALHVLALTRFALDDNAGALAHMREAIALDPTSAAFHSDLGIMLHGAGEFAESVAASRRSLELRPNDAATLNSLGAALSSLDQVEEAIAAYRRALVLKPNYHECWANLGHSQQLLMRLDDAAGSYRRALGIQYDYPQAQIAASMLTLLRGDFANGFTQYEWRWRLKSMTPRDFKQPAWQGEPLDGKTILLHAEQGAGDNIQCLRFVPQVAALGGRLLLELPPNLTRLATSLDGGGEIIAQGHRLPHFDVHCAFMSLPRVLGTTLETLPAPSAYLRADPAAAQRWGERLAGTGSGLKVGIAWAGNPAHAGDRRRSIALERLAPLLDVPRTRFYSLQVGERAADLARLPPGRVVDLAPDLKSFADTAAALAHLDLVIAVDTSIVHLAGALGRPCWVMIPFSPDWRWLIGREDSPWYPSLRLFRQRKLSDWDEVIARVRAALAERAAPQPSAQSQLDANALNDEAVRLRAAGRNDEAEAIARRILAAAPDHDPTLRLLGVLRDEAGDHAAAADLFARLIELSPDDAEAHYNLATAFLALSRHAEAIGHFQRAIALAPDHAKAFSNLSSALRGAGRFAEAEEAARKAVALAPDLITACNNFATALAERGRFDEAIKGFRRAIALKPDFVEGFFNLGKALQGAGRRDEAIVQFRRAIEIRPDYAEANLAEAFFLLVTGDYAAGLPKLEWRWRLDDHRTRDFAQPVWRGEPLAGKTILLHAEQGFGDCLMLLRYAPLVAARGGRVVLEVPAGLERLVALLKGGPYTTVVAGQPLPAFDAHCPLMSLPLAFGTTPETIPVPVPYFTPAPDDVARWRARLAGSTGMKVGLVWAGNPVHKADRMRSIALARLAPLLDVAGVQWFSLQVGDRAADLASLGDGRITDLAPELTDFAETAAAIMALDLVIAVDTGVVHLAGALGRPVWIMLAFDPDWRWLLERGDSPWYPSARLIRQRTPGDWDGVIARVRAALIEVVERVRRGGAPPDAPPPSTLDRRYFAAVELLEAHRDAEAEGALRAILAEDGGHALTLRRLAFLCHRRGDNAEAAALLARSLEREPDNADAHFNLGVVLSALGRHAEAEKIYRRGLVLKPGLVDGHNNLGVVLEQMGRYDEAEASYRRAHELAPHLAHPLNNLGVLLKESGRLEEAIATHRRAVALDPELPAAHSNLLYTLIYDATVLPQALFAAHEAWGRAQAARFATAGARFINAPDPERRLRVGYVSGDFRHHSVAFFAEALLAAHDKRAVEVFLYANDARVDAVTQRLKGHADHFVPIHGVADDAAAARIRADGIDILVDLSGHTSANRMMLFARKPAPVQVTWLGYPATTGLPTIDCRITDAVADPPGEADALHTERLVRIDSGFLCYRPLDRAGAVGPLPAHAAGYVTFGSFNNFAKLSPGTIALWARLLREVPDARLLLKATQFKDAATRARCLAAFTAAGIAAERIEIVPPLADPADHLALYGRVDIGLDPLIYNGTTTTCEALLMGVPTVTLRGDRHVSRVGASIMTTVGLGELIAETLDDYIAIAARLARDLDRLATLRSGMRERLRASPLCDAPRFAGAMETAYRDMWRRWCAAQGVADAAPAGQTRPPDTAETIAAAEAEATRLFTAKKFPEAEAALHALTARAPERAMPWFLLGRVRHALGDNDAAIDFLRKAAELDPAMVPAHNDLGILLQGRGKLEEAEACYGRAIELAPHFAEAMSNLGAVLAERGRLEQATEWYNRALAERNDLPDAHNNLGSALVKLDRAGEAEALHRRAIELKPDFADAHYNLGVALHDQGRFDEALACYEKAIRLNPDSVDAHWNRAFVLLLKGDFAQGWREHEWRWKRKQQPPRSFPQPLWRGEDIAKRTILLHDEQGMGDTLQFMRYAPLVAARGARVLLQVQRPLLRLAAASLDVGIEVFAEGDLIPPFEMHSPLLSLPLACGTMLETIPGPIPYIEVDPAAAARWRNRIGPAAGLKVGLVWAGNPQHKNDRNRSIALERLAPLFDAPGVRWFSLQVGERAADLARAPAGKIANLADRLTDFGETAAAVAGLDLVIAVDTATAHLAGALGKPVWILLPFVPDWRWLVGRDDSPWYPTARLFRQPVRGDWESVAQSVRAALAELAGKIPARKH